jgi:threonine dehydratase
MPSRTVEKQGVSGLAVEMTREHIDAARRRIGSAVLRTPLLPARGLSELTQADVFVKYENLQITHSFKERGALAKLSSLPPRARARGVIAMSAGNHAQAVAFHAGRLEIPATIVMPGSTPLVKVAATEQWGAEVVLEPGTLEACESRAEALAAERQLTFVHPYDDADVIAGQGTLALEMLEDAPDLDVLVFSVGGGGLIAGNAIAAKSIKPGIGVYGAEALLFPSMWNAIKGEARPIGGATLAEGIAVKNVGQLTLPVVRALVDDLILVDEDMLERAVNAYATLQKTMAEGAGAAPLAAMLGEPQRFRSKKVGLVLSGGNIDPRVLATIMIRDLEREGRITAFRLTIPDQPGALGRITTRLGQLGANILEVQHSRLLLDVPAKGTEVSITIETRDRAHAQNVLAALAAEGYRPAADRRRGPTLG